MKYYDEGKMRAIRLKLEEEVLRWPEVTTRKMYGCPCYKFQKRLFAFLVTDGIVITKSSEVDKTVLSTRFSSMPFQAGKRTMKGWPQIRLKTASDLDAIIPFVKSSYDLAKSELDEA
jgi:hypothetical protein